MKEYAKKILLALAVVGVALLVSSCKAGIVSKDSRVLVVEICDSTESADLTLVKEGLAKGGYIKLSVDAAKTIDPKFEEKYANMDSYGYFMKIPSMLNFVAGQGWSFQQKFCINMNESNAEYYFIR